MCDRTAPPGEAMCPGPDLGLDPLDKAVRALARDALDMLGHVRTLEAEVGALSRSTLDAAWAIEQARRHRDG